MLSILDPKLRLRKLADLDKLPFYFGGSQVPINLEFPTKKGKGIKPTIMEEDKKLYNKKNVKPENIRYY